jgi:peptidoglycan/xylan/chitin deacetylase (PgdA/CDA1 family)
MRRRLLTAIAACFYYSGLVALARWWARRSGPHLVILNYHRASGGSLRRQLLYLRRHYRLCTLEAALEELYTPRKDTHYLLDRRTPLVLTFDDGYRDNYMHAFALAQELHIPLSIYLVPSYIESGGYFWWQERKHLVRSANVREITLDSRTYHLDHPAERQALSAYIDTQARYASSVAMRETFLAAMRKQLQVSATVNEEDVPAMPMTWQQIHEMEQSGWVSFGAHTMHHPVLSSIADQAEVAYELTECRKVLEQQLGHPVRSLAYPIGQRQHISKDVVEAVRQAGYSWAVTTNYGFNVPQTDPYVLNRIETDVSQHWLVVAAEAAGLWGLFSRLRWIPLLRKHLTNAGEAGSQRK